MRKGRFFWMLLFWGVWAVIKVQAQPKEMLDMAARYPGENGVILNKSEHLIFKFDNQSRLIATSEVDMEILLLNDLAPGIFNTSNIYHSSFHKLLSWEAFSLVPNKNDYRSVKASVLKSTNLKSENVLYDDNKVTVLGFPGLVRLSIVKSHYEIQHTELHFLQPFYFQSSLPVAKASFRITAPKSVAIKTILRYIDSSLFAYNVEERKHSVSYSWTVTNINRYKDYANSPDGPFGLPHIIPYLSGYVTPDKKDVAMISDPKGLYRFIYGFIRNVNQSDLPEIEKQVKEIISGCSTDRCKAEQIYKWVQEHIRYVAFEDSLGGYIPREAGVVMQRRYGDCKDMSSLLVAMLRSAGLKAFYTWIGTRGKPYPLSEVPLPLNFNHMICAWQSDSSWVFMDGTHSTIRFGVPPYGLQGKDAMVSIDDTHFEIVRIPELAPEVNRSVDTTWISIKEPGELEGKVKVVMNGYPEWIMKSRIRYSSESEKDKIIKSVCSRASNKFFQKSGRYESAEDGITFYSDFNIKDYVQKIDKEIYINLNLTRYNSGQRIDDIRLRQVPIMNQYKALLSEVVCLEIPEGFTVAHLPADAKHIEPGVWGYTIHYEQKGNQVICYKQFLESELYISPSAFVMNNQLADELNELYKETVVLKANAK